MSNKTKSLSYTLADRTKPPDELTPLDASWILMCAFLVFTMQTGFGLLEAGIVSKKNETNIFLKNVVDVILGGFTYWIFGYGIMYGTWPGSSPVFGIGHYAVDSPTIEPMGDLFTSFFFQLSFATTSTTIVSGAMAERCNFKAYCLYSLFATITYSVQARWIWGPTGFLKELGVIDLAGSGAVHLAGGAAAFVSAWMLGPRMGRYDEPEAPPPGNPTNVLIGSCSLWWSWFAFNAGSTYGMTGEKWKFSARSAATTLVASIGGGMIGIFWGFFKGRGKGPFDVLYVVNAVLGSLVAITAGCGIFHTPESFLTGVIGAIVTLAAAHIPDKFKVDDPVSATAVHGFAGVWGMLSVGFFADEDGGVLGVTKGNAGFIRGGDGHLLGVQLLAVVCIIAWALISTFIILLLIGFVIPLRVPLEDEKLGLDFCEHGIERRGGGSCAGSQDGSEFSDRHFVSLKRCKRSKSNIRPSSRKLKKSVILLWRAFKRLKSSNKNEITQWNPKDTCVEYSIPVPSAATTRPAMENIYPSDSVQEFFGGGCSLRDDDTKIFEWRRKQTEQKVLIVKNM